MCESLLDGVFSHGLRPHLQLHRHGIPKHPCRRALDQAVADSRLMKVGDLGGEFTRCVSGHIYIIIISCTYNNNNNHNSRIYIYTHYK